MEIQALETSPGSVLDEAREPGVAFQGPLCGWVGETGATAGDIALWPVYSQKSKNFFPFHCPISEPGKQGPGWWT